MEIKHQVIVVGAGPAGLNAAKYAANAGCDVALIDSGKRLGGQYWRNTGNEVLDQSTHHDFDKGSLLMDAVKANPRITIYLDTPIWSASIIDQRVVLRTKDSSFITQRLILATGAYDRAIPFPGWDIPGVMTAGAAQSLLKGSGVVAGKRIIVGGTGPFLLPVASGLAEHGAEHVEICEATGRLAWLPQLHVLLNNPNKILEALPYVKTLRRNRVRTHYREAIVEAHANESGVLHAVTVARINSDFAIISRREIECDVAAISWGFTVDTALALSLGLSASVANDGSVCIETDEDQLASAHNGEYKIFAAGELTGIGGSDLALIEGAIAGLAAANARETKRNLYKVRKKLRRFAEALQRVYPIPLGWKEWLTPQTIICRCEEVDYKDFSEAVRELNATDSRSIKLMTRCGMGMCQGRMCARNISDLLGSNDEDRINGTKRPIITPITLGELAQEGLL
jgi:NADPH-dependent 2,4-dienoyl-CoA reductase/sulfur reductase-like enzyme